MSKIAKLAERAQSAITTRAKLLTDGASLAVQHKSEEDGCMRNAMLAVATNTRWRLMRIPRADHDAAILNVHVGTTNVQACALAGIKDRDGRAQLIVLASSGNAERNKPSRS